MGTVTTSLVERASGIFRDLGYAVDADGSELRATRKWRTVHVTPMPEPGVPPASGEMRCFVTWADRVDALEGRLERADPDYEWAIIGVEDDRGEYVVSGRTGAD